MEEVRSTVELGGRKYPLIVSPQEAELIPELENEINQRIKSLRSQYANLDIQDCLALTLIDLKMNQIYTKQHESIDKDTLSLVDEIQDLLK